MVWVVKEVYHPFSDLSFLSRPGVRWWVLMTSPLRDGRFHLGDGAGFDCNVIMSTPLRILWISRISGSCWLIEFNQIIIVGLVLVWHKNNKLWLNCSSFCLFFPKSLPSMLIPPSWSLPTGALPRASEVSTRCLHTGHDRWFGSENDWMMMMMMMMVEDHL